eukprot:scaffold4769_cov72-Skeletonema_dohrnii-CCMP3373.AAC.1
MASSKTDSMTPSETLAVAVGLLDNNGVSSDNASDKQEDSSNNHHQTPIEKSIDILTKLQIRLSRSGTLSNNEVLDDVATSSLEFIGVEYHLGRAFLMLPTYQLGSSNNNNNNNSNSASPSILRKTNITRATDYFHAYLKKVDQLDLLNEATIKEYHTLLDMEDIDDDDAKSRPATTRMNQSQIREMKIQRFQRKRAASQKQAQFQSLLQRRSRLGLAQEEEMEGHDFESLSRTLYIETLRLYAEECLEEIQSCLGELEMLDMAIQMERGRMISQDPRMHSDRIHSRNGAAAAGGL